MSEIKTLTIKGVDYSLKDETARNAITEKQDVISDLATIRSGATAGSTAIQPNDNISELTNDSNYQTGTQVSSAISTHDSSTAAHNDIRSAIADKSTVSVSATGTATDEVQYITVDGVQKKLAGGGSEEDNLSITKNASDKIQTIGVIDQNDTTRAVKEWFGTRDEYDAIASKDPNTEYTITDDSDLSMPILQALYPVGASFITFNETCPLANLFGTWQKVGTKLLVDVNSTVPVVGNGMTLGLTNGTLNVGLVTASGDNALRNRSSGYGVPYNTADTSGNTIDGKTLGITTDGTKSGIIADLSSAKTEMTINIFRRTA